MPKLTPKKRAERKRIEAEIILLEEQLKYLLDKDKEGLLVAYHK